MSGANPRTVTFWLSFSLCHSCAHPRASWAIQDTYCHVPISSSTNGVWPCLPGSRFSHSSQRKSSAPGGFAPTAVQMLKPTWKPGACPAPHRVGRVASPPVPLLGAEQDKRLQHRLQGSIEGFYQAICLWVMSLASGYRVA